MTFLATVLASRDLVHELVSRDLKVRYRRSAFGFLWTMLQPLMTMGVMTVVFSSIFRFDIRNFPVYALAGILFYNFFQQTIIASMNSLKANAPILHKLPVPLIVFPVATTISGIINLVFALVPLLVIMIVTGHPLTWALLFVPVAALIAALFTLGAGMLLAPLAVFFHDTVELVGVLLMLVMYLTPTFYPMSILPDKFRPFVRFNPVRSILEIFRDPIYYGKIPPLSHLSVAVGITLLVLWAGSVAFRRSIDRIPFYA